MKLTENKLRTIIKETINKILNENYSLNDTDILMEYFWLKPNKTKLNVDIFVDDGEAYKRYGHQLLLYIRNGYDKTINEFIIMSVEKQPKILNSEIEYNISYNDIFDVQDFIVYNLSNLQKLADREINHNSFVNNIIMQRYAIAESKCLLTEMATLRVNYTHLKEGAS